MGGQDVGFCGLERTVSVGGAGWRPSVASQAPVATLPGVAGHRCQRLGVGEPFSHSCPLPVPSVV